MNPTLGRYRTLAREWKDIGISRAGSLGDRTRELWRHGVTEGRELMAAVREVNWGREAKDLFDRLSNSAHLYLTFSLVLGSAVMWFTGVQTGVLVVTLMTVPLAMLKLIIRIVNQLEDEHACEEHFTLLMDTCLKHWEQSGSFREHLGNLLAMMDEAHRKMDQSDPMLRRAYYRYYARHQKRINAHFLMVFGFPVSVMDLQGESCAVTRMMTTSGKMRRCWEAQHGPYQKGKPLDMEQFLWLMHSLPVVYDLR